MNLDFSTSEASQLLKKHKIALSPKEAQDLQKKIGRPLSLLEATILGIQLSEHCSYKSSRKFLKTLPTKGEYVILGPAEDAGILKVFEYNKETYCIAVGHESHNHPSQIVPYEGAATGIGGIVRDILCMGSRPIGSLDQLRFGDPQKSYQSHIASEVIKGVAGYGNPLGVPNLGGDVYFDKGFDENCLVNVVALGSLRKSDLIHSYVPPNAANEAWDLIIIGKPTDNSGFGGASFASDTFEAIDDIDSKKAAVQEPNPFLERHIIASTLDLFEILKKEGTYHQVAFKDLGAGGVTCATVEIAEGGGFGAEINLDNLHVAGNYPPHIIACSETQERFCWACHPHLTQQIIDHYEKTWELGYIADKAGASLVGKIRADGQYIVKSGNSVLCDLPAKLVTQGILYDRPYEIHTPKEVKTEVSYHKGEIIWAS